MLRQSENKYILPFLHALDALLNKGIILVRVADQMIVYANKGITDYYPMGVSKEEIALPTFFQSNMAENDYCEIASFIAKARKHFGKNNSELLSDYSFSFHFNSQFAGQANVLHLQCAPIVDYSSVRFAICFVSPSASEKQGGFMIKSQSPEITLKFNPHTSTFEKVTPITLNVTEKLILIHTNHGLSVDEIATKINLTVNAVKSSKHRMFDKMGVKNISEAICYAENYRLL